MVRQIIFHGTCRQKGKSAASLTFFLAFVFVILTTGLIEKSGMVYSQEWVTGNIRGNQIGKIPKDLLLVCLVSSRFAKAQDLLLSGLTRDFEVTGTVQEAINAWKFAGYHKVRTVGEDGSRIQWCWQYNLSLLYSNAFVCPSFKCRFSPYPTRICSSRQDDEIATSVLFLSVAPMLATRRLG
jgi:hypothetical protein